MTMKIDTQGMSYGTGEGGKSIEEQRAAIPDVKPKQYYNRCFEGRVKRNY